MWNKEYEFEKIGRKIPIWSLFVVSLQVNNMQLL